MLLSTGLAQAQDTEPDPSALQVHGFVSQGYIKSTSNNYLAPSARAQGSFDFTEVGINFTKPLTDKLRVGLQIFAHDLGPLGNYAPQLDWYYLDYRFFDWLGIRAGKTKLPWGLYNEYNDVDAGRVPILLPQSVYPVANREVLFAQTGVELYGDVPLDAAGSLEYRAYGGTIFINTADASVQLKGFEVPYEFGGRVMWHPPLPGLQLGGSAQAVRLDFSYAPTAEQAMAYQAQGQLPADYNGTISIKLPVQLFVASVEYQVERLTLAAELGRDYIKYTTNLLTPVPKVVSEGYYLMASYQVKSWFTPGIYYSTLLPNTELPIQKRSTYQRDLAVTLRSDITPNWLVKLEGHYMHGTGGLRRELNDNKPLDSLDKNWAVFLAKTTCYF
ncbi:MAG TPA: hypothetical protein VNG33_22980 [Polyangiaceae bacterium]|nr:hypothetical protein [Polyangiaceae bacterium]